MIKCHLSRLMGERRLKIADVAKDTKLNRGTLTRIYHEQSQRIELEVLNKLCNYFQCPVSDIYEWVDEGDINTIEKDES